MERIEEAKITITLEKISLTIQSILETQIPSSTIQLSHPWHRRNDDESRFLDLDNLFRIAISIQIGVEIKSLTLCPSSF
jgi:hypothetical protein